LGAARGHGRNNRDAAQVLIRAVAARFVDAGGGLRAGSSTARIGRRGIARCVGFASVALRMDDRCMPKPRHKLASASQSRDRSERTQLVIDAIAVSMLPGDTDSSDSSDEMWMRNHPTPRRSSIAFHPYAMTTMATPRRRNDLRIFHSMSFDVAAYAYASTSRIAACIRRIEPIAFHPCNLPTDLSLAPRP
jgi:hypothetical protein